MDVGCPLSLFGFSHADSIPLLAVAIYVLFSVVGFWEELLRMSPECSGNAWHILIDFKEESSEVYSGRRGAKGYAQNQVKFRKTWTNVAKFW